MRRFVWYNGFKSNSSKRYTNEGGIIMANTNKTNIAVDLNSHKTMEFDRESNPAALLMVMPCSPSHKLPVAVFIKYNGMDNWQQYTKEYWYRKCAVNMMRSIEIMHYAYKVIGEDNGR